jgi:hypothetical protein
LNTSLRTSAGRTEILTDAWSKRKKDELDLIRLAEKFPQLISRYPEEVCRQLDRGQHPSKT